MLFEYEFDDLQILVGHVDVPSEANPKVVHHKAFWAGSFEGRAIIDMHHAGDSICIDQLWLKGWADFGHLDFNQNRTELEVEPLDPLFKWIEKALIKDRDLVIRDQARELMGPYNPNKEHRLTKSQLGL